MTIPGRVTVTQKGSAFDDKMAAMMMQTVERAMKEHIKPYKHVEELQPGDTVLVTNTLIDQGFIDILPAEALAQLSEEDIKSMVGKIAKRVISRHQDGKFNIILEF